YGHPTTSVILLAQVQVGSMLQALSPAKLEAALTAALEVTGRYSVVPTVLRDSVVVLLQREGQVPTALAVARRLNCSALCFALAERFVHLVRVEVALRWAPEFEEERRGVGYALLRYVQVGSEDFLYDPSLLEATQRAVAVALGDSDLYAALDPPLRVYPAPLLAVCGIAYSEESGLPPWQLFLQKVVTSYDAVLSAIDTARFHPRFVVLDIDTRDTIYAMGRLFEPENYNPPTLVELGLLLQMGVEYFLSGSLHRTREGAQLRMELYRIGQTRGGIVPELVCAAQSFVSEDSLQRFRKVVRHLVGQLLWQNQ
ncbi:MAG: hypothetical protein NZ949_08215, partial [Candidatus Kapabacteria bacterium]|nr:hypothetical protein [Candidatus Kapabacteria bacterium]